MLEGKRKYIKIKKEIIKKGEIKKDEGEEGTKEGQIHCLSLEDPARGVLIEESPEEGKRDENQ